MPNFGKCLLHVPHKDWSGNPKELENYTAIERWVRKFYTECLTTTTCVTDQWADIQESWRISSSTTPAVPSVRKNGSAGSPFEFEITQSGWYQVDLKAIWVMNPLGSVLSSIASFDGSNTFHEPVSDFVAGYDILAPATVTPETNWPSGSSWVVFYQHVCHLYGVVPAGSSFSLGKVAQSSGSNATLYTVWTARLMCAEEIE